MASPTGARSRGEGRQSEDESQVMVGFGDFGLNCLSNILPGSHLFRLKGLGEGPYLSLPIRAQRSDLDSRLGPSWSASQAQADQPQEAMLTPLKNVV